MRLERKNELQRKRIDKQRESIDALNVEIEKLKFNLDFLKNENINGYEAAKKIILLLEKIRIEWQESLDSLNLQRDEYQSLIAEVKLMKKVLDKEVYKSKWRIIKYLIK